MKQELFQIILLMLALKKYGQCRIISFSYCDRLESALLHTCTIFQCSWLNGSLVMEKVFEVFKQYNYGHSGQFWSCDKAYLLEHLFLQPMEARCES